jgi:GT2 family glycosyltransferase
MKPLVTVTIVTYNSGQFIERCLEAVRRQEYWPLEVIIVDNSSTDGSAGLLAGYKRLARVIHNDRNVGFAAAQNQAIGASRGDWVLTLNPDVRLHPDFIERLVAAGRLDAKVGVVCGKLRRATPDLGIPAEPRIDSTGIYFTPTLRHLDRGWNEPDDGRFRQAEYVFGASAAAALYRRDMISDVALDDGFFDPDFFTYREDADVAWRAQLMGWRCIYVPHAVGYHVRRVVPGNRRSTPAVLRMHSVKNRFLMRVKNMTSDLYRRQWLPMTLRDLLVVGGCLLSEPGSLPAFWRIAKCFRRALAKRRQIMSRRKASDDYMASWFRERPRSHPLKVQAHHEEICSGAFSARV